MHGIKTFGLFLGQMHEAHGTDLESLSFNALENRAGQVPLHGVGLDDGQRPLGHPAIIAGASSALCPKEAIVTPMAAKQQHDPDVHKGAIEGDRPTDEQIGNPHGDGVNDDGLPDDPIAIAEDAIGANEDETQG